MNLTLRRHQKLLPGLPRIRDKLRSVPRNIGVLMPDRPYDRSFVLESGAFPGTYTIRPLTPDDYRELRMLRLEALENFGEFFGPRAEDEARFTDEEWQERCRGNAEGRCILGLFHDSWLIGIASIKPAEEDPTGQTALWCQAYLRPAYHGHKIFSPLRDARIAWTKDQPQYKRAVFFIHQENEISRGAHAVCRPRHTGKRPMDWPGRPDDPWDFFEVDLNR